MKKLLQREREILKIKKPTWNNYNELKAIQFKLLCKVEKKILGKTRIDVI